MGIALSDNSPLEQFKKDCHDILKKLDCYGDESEVTPFVFAMIRYQTANDDFVLQGYESAFETFKNCWEGNGRYAQKIKALYYDFVKADKSNAELKAKFLELFPWIKDEEELARIAPAYFERGQAPNPYRASKNSNESKTSQLPPKGVNLSGCGPDLRSKTK